MTGAKGKKVRVRFPPARHILKVFCRVFCRANSSANFGDAHLLLCGISQAGTPPGMRTKSQTLFRSVSFKHESLHYHPS